MFLPNANSDLTEYANILDEIRIRILGINTIVAGTKSLQSWVTAELCYLQLRLLCELVAIGCLIAHGDIEATKCKKIQKKYAADDIINQLEKLHPDFYPHPVKCSFSIDNIQLERIESGYLTKQELITLYHECGGHLHRGSLSSIFHATKPKLQPTVEQALAWGQKFSILLSQHHIVSHTNHAHLLAFLSHHQADGKALAVIAKSPDLDQNLEVSRSENI